MVKLKNQKVFDEIMELLGSVKKKDRIVHSIMKDLLYEAYVEYNKGSSQGIDKQLYMWIEKEIEKRIKEVKNDDT